MTALGRKEAHKERCGEMSGGGSQGVATGSAETTQLPHDGRAKEAKEDKATGNGGADKEGSWIMHSRALGNAMAEFYEGILTGGAVNTSAQDAYLDMCHKEARCRQHNWTAEERGSRLL